MVTQQGAQHFITPVATSLHIDPQVLNAAQIQHWRRKQQAQKQQEKHGSLLRPDPTNYLKNLLRDGYK